MAIPDATVSIKDNALGVVPANSNSTQAFIGTCSSGTIDTVYQYNDIQALKDGHGTGPLVEAAAHTLSVAGGPVVVIRTTGSVAGAAGAVTAGASNTGLSVLTLTGSVPLDSYLAVIKIVTGGTNPAAATATFKVSLDNARSYGPEIALPASGVYAIPSTGITLNFSAATLVAADTYSFSTTAPGYSVANFNTTWDALVADSAEWFMCNIVGVPADSAAAVALFAAADSKLTTAATNYRYTCAMISASAESDATVAAGLLSSTSTRMLVSHGFCRLTSQINGSQVKRPASIVIGARASKVAPSEDLGRVASGNVPGVTLLDRDEFRTPGMDAKFFSTLRTHIGLRGFYITNARMFSSPSSDYQYIQHRRVMDIASKGARLVGLHYLNDSVRVSASTGYILEEDALGIEAYGNALLRTMVTQPGYASDIAITVDRAVNMLSTNSLVLHVRVIPLGYAKTITVDIGFFNPALQPV